MRITKIEDVEYPCIVEAGDLCFMVDNEEALHQTCFEIVVSRLKLFSERRDEPETVDQLIENFGVSRADYLKLREYDKLIYSIEELEERALFNKLRNKKLSYVRDIIEGVRPKSDAVEYLVSNLMIDIYKVGNSNNLEIAS